MATVASDTVPISNGNTTTIEEKFEAALNVIKSLPKNGSYKPDPRMMLKFYSYYKQATEGPCTKAKPWAWDVINKAKWEAWSRLGDMPKEKAMESYVENLKLIVEAMPATDNVQGFIQTLGDFYEIVELEPPDQFKKHTKLVTSTPYRSSEQHVANGNLKMNGDASGDSSDSEKDEIPVNGLDSHAGLNGNAPVNGKEDYAQEDEHPSDSEDEFCDTAEEIQVSNDSPMHSYTMINTDGQTESSSKSDSISTLDSTMDGESPHQDESYATTSTVKVRSRGGEHGTRGSDKTSSSQKGGTSHTSGQSGMPQRREMDDTWQRPGPPGGAGGGRGPPYSYSEVQDQIATTLLQLQQDMNSVLNRLSILEALTVGQQARRGRTISGDSVSSSSSRRHASKAREVAPSWWPFTELSPKALFFIITWPFIARWIMHIISKRRMRQ